MPIGLVFILFLGLASIFIYVLFRYRTTHLRQSDNAMQNSETRLQGREPYLPDLLKNLPGVVYRIVVGRDGATRVEFVSEGIRELVGQAPESVTNGNITIWDMIDPQDIDKVKEWPKHDYRVGESYVFDYRIHTADGAIRWMRDLGRCVKISSEEKTFEGILTDITKSRQTELDLEKRLEREKLLARVSHLFINISDADIDEAIGQSMQSLGQFAEADRSYFRLLTMGEKHIQNAWDWQSAQAPTRAMTMVGLNLTLYQWSYTRLLTGETLIVKNIKDLSAEAAPEKKLWSDLGIVSIIMAPIFFNKEFVGVIGLNTECFEREWNQEDGRLLTLIGEILINTLENRQANQALRESEARWRATFNAAGIGIDLVDTKGCYLETNPALQTMLGFSAEELRGRHVSQLTHPDDRENELWSIQHRYQAPYERNQFEKRVTRKDGSLAWLRITTSVVTDANNQPLFSIGMVEDFTEKKVMDEALTASEARYRNLFENTPISLWEEDFSRAKSYLQDLHKKGIGDIRAYLQANPDLAVQILRLIWINDVNQATLKLFEADHKSQIVGRFLNFPPDARFEAMLGEVAALDENRYFYSDEGFLAYSMLGKKLQTNLFWTVLPGHEKDWSRVLVSIVDITESKRKDEILRASERKYRALVNAIPDLLYRIHRDGTYLEILPFKELEPLYAPEEIIGKKVAEIMPPPDAARRMELIQLALETNQPQIHEYTVMQKGQKRYSEGRIVACGEDEILIIIRDFTDRKLMEEELRLAYAEMERRVRERTAQLEKTNLSLQAEIQERLSTERQLESANERLTALSKKLIEIQETEKSRLAYELHDQIGQLLTGLQFSLETAKRTSDIEARNQIIKAQVLVTELMVDVRNLALSLRPKLLDDMGVLPALLWYFERYTDQTQVQVHFSHTGLDQRFAPEIETSVFRIVQEALTNVARHSGVKEVKVRLWADETNLQIQVEDQGLGYNYNQILQQGQTGGIVSMQERVNWLSGQLNISTAPGFGTRIIADIPLVRLQEEKI